MKKRDPGEVPSSSDERLLLLPLGAAGCTMLARRIIAGHRLPLRLTPLAHSSRALCKSVVKADPNKAGDGAIEKAPLTNEKGEVSVCVCERVHARRVALSEAEKKAQVWQHSHRPRRACAQIIANWGSSVELPEVTKEQAEEAFKDATSVSRALTPPTAQILEARKDMLTDRFNYVEKHVTNPDAQYVVMGGKGVKVAPAAVGQGSFMIGGLVVLMGAIASVVYIRTQWDVANPKELGDRLREKGAARREALERSKSATLVRSISQNAETTVKSNVELVRRPSQQLGEHFNESFKGVIKENR